MGAYRLTVRLGREARRGWGKAARHAGCSVTALEEAIGRAFDLDPQKMLEHCGEIIDEARVIDEERRKR